MPIDDIEHECSRAHPIVGKRRRGKVVDAFEETTHHGEQRAGEREANEGPEGRAR